MEAIQILRSAEELLFDVVQWPRSMWTMFRQACFAPWRARAHVAEQWSREPSQRFKWGSSPILFWLLAVVLPYFLVVERCLGSAAATHPWLGFLEGQPRPIRFFVVAFFLAAGPLACARVICKARRESGSRDALHRIFSAQCLVLAPAYLVFLLALVIAFASPPAPSTAALALTKTLLVMSVASVLYVELAVVRGELRVGWLRTAVTVMNCVTAWWTRVLLVMIALMILYALATG